MSFKLPDHQDRQAAAAAARKAMLEKFRAASTDPALEQKLAERAEIHKARQAREAEREAARKAREAELEAERQRKAEEEAKLQAELEAEAARLKQIEEEAHLALLAEQKAARDARYAARKAAKKERRRGY
jgi:membrane protein involved in colicin uptake